MLRAMVSIPTTELASPCPGTNPTLPSLSKPGPRLPRTEAAATRRHVERAIADPVTRAQALHSLACNAKFIQFTVQGDIRRR